MTRPAPPFARNPYLFTFGTKQGEKYIYWLSDLK